jgi:hypothetical protein
MTWVITVALVGLLLPNLFKLISVSTKLLGGMPAYLRWVGGDPAVLEDKDTRVRLQSAFAKIFFSIQTHALNVVVCALLGWTVWHGRLPTLSLWLRYLVSGVSIAAGVSNLIIARHLIGEFSRVQETGRAIAQLEARLGRSEDQRGSSFTTADAVSVWAAIGMYVVSAVACAGLVYLVWP